MIGRYACKIKKFILVALVIFAAAVACAAVFGCSDDEDKSNGDAKYHIARYSAETGGEIYGNVRQSVVHGSDCVAVTAVPDKGYVFTEWSDGVTTAERTDKAVMSNISVRARFEKVKYTVEYLADGNGHINGITEQLVAYGEFAGYIEAVPEEGYEFYKWSDGLTRAYRADTVLSNMRVTAIFKVKQLKVEYYSSNENLGEIIGETKQTVLYGETCSTVTAVPKDGYVFAGWSDGVMTAERTDINVKDNIKECAWFQKPSYKVTYKTSGVGFACGQIRDDSRTTNIIDYNVFHGEDAKTVTAVPQKNYAGEEFVFLYWSDGVTAPERTDTDITEDMIVTAYFGYTVDYIVNNGTGGRIEGKAKQKLLPEERSEEVTAVPDDGYVFRGWSDLSMNRTRSGDGLSEEVQRNYYAVLEIVAYFEPIEKTFTYEYGEGVTPLEKQITLNRNDIKSARFAVPTRAGYDFCGWYADSEYDTRITDGNGKYMYGYAAFSLDSDTLYARWQKSGDNYDPHKILLVFVDEIDCDVRSVIDKQTYGVHTKMTALDYAYFNWIVAQFDALLSECLDGIADVEVDAYYTTDALKSLNTGHPIFNGEPFAPEIPEVAVFEYAYHNTLTYYDYGEMTYSLINWSGIACGKHGTIHCPLPWQSVMMKHKELEQCKNGKVNSITFVLETFFHEFIHTAQNNFENRSDTVTLHVAENYAIYNVNSLVASRFDVAWEYMYKPFLLDKFDMNGKICGIPIEYWQHKHDIELFLTPIAVDYQSAGDINIVEGDVYSYYGNIYLKSKSRLKFEAVPLAGYRFVKWSDGNTSAVREFDNVMSEIYISAIFEKIIDGGETMT